MSFDAREIAERALNEGDDPLATVINQLAGFASVCWEDMSGTGTFQSEDAAAAAASTVDWIRNHTTVQVGEGQRLVLVVARSVPSSEVAKLQDVAVDGHHRLLVIDEDFLRTAYVADGPVVVEDDEPRLGCATTAELIGELNARAQVGLTIGEAWPAYRTVES